MADQNRRTILPRQHPRGRLKRPLPADVVRGFCTAVALRSRCAPAIDAITSDQDDPSANRPCTSTTLRALGEGCAAAALPWKRMLCRCRPAATVLTKARRSIGYFGRRSSWLSSWKFSSQLEEFELPLRLPGLIFLRSAYEAFRGERTAPSGVVVRSIHWPICRQPGSQFPRARRAQQPEKDRW